jgi:methyl-accepting chemotaxis protein
MSETAPRRKSPAAPPNRRKGGFGLRAKLFFAFGAVAGLTVLASAIAFVSYADVGRALGAITGESLPAMSASVRLAKSSAEIASIAPALAAAQNLEDRDTTMTALKADQAALRQAIDAIAASGGQGATIDTLRGTAAQMSKNLDDLAKDVERRINLDSQIAAQLGLLRSSYDAVDQAVAPLIRDTSAEIAKGLQSVGGLKDSAAIQQQLVDVEAMHDLRADANLVLGLLTEGAGLRSKDLLPPLLKRFKAASDHIDKSLTALAKDQSAVILRPAVGELLDYGHGGQSLFMLRNTQLQAGEDGQAALQINHKFAATLQAAVSTLVTKNEGAAKTVATATDAAIARGRVLLISIAGLSLLVAVVIGGFYIGRSVVRRLGALSGSMAEIAAGNFDAAIPAGGSDEIAQMASALTVFRDAGRAAKDAEAQSAAERRRMAEQRRAELLSLADAFETTVKSVVDSVSTAATEMQSAAAGLAKTADESSQQAAAVAAASSEASANVQMVATATEEMSSSTAEIGRQVSESAEVAARAVSEAERTNASVQGLAEAARRIGDVVSLINDIASQTNLLALNATIEAARAGEAGKGFAVVAGEVKALATQTAKATDEIAAQIGEIQGATKNAVAAIAEIGKTIGRISEIATAVASAVEEQNATTREIARNVQQAAEGTHGVSTNIAGVTSAVSETGSAARIVLSSAGALAEESRKLSDEVERFLGSVRAR